MNKKLKAAWVVIFAYIIIGIIAPNIIKFAVFENPAHSLLPNDGWASFLGSYIGGVLGGLGTLIAMFFTIKHSVEVQEQDRKDADERMATQNLITQKEANNERLARKAEQELAARRALVDGIADQVGMYITHISKYVYEHPVCRRLDKEVKQACDDLYKKKREYESFRESLVSGPGVSVVPSAAQSMKKEDLEREIAELKEAYQRKQDEQKEHNMFAMRLEANEAYFTIETKLEGIEEAKDLIRVLEETHNLQGLDYDAPSPRPWIEGKTDELKGEYHRFEERYVR